LTRRLNFAKIAHDHPAGQRQTMPTSRIEIRIKKVTPGLWAYLVVAVGFFAAAAVMLASGRILWHPLATWAGAVLFGVAAILLGREILAPKIVARLTAQGIEDALGLIRWTDVSDAGLCATRGRENLWLTLPSDRYPTRAHPMNQQSPDLAMWQVDLRRNRSDLDAIRDLVEERLGRNSTHASASPSGG
jgi:hypothetical protein